MISLTESELKVTIASILLPFFLVGNAKALNLLPLQTEETQLLQVLPSMSCFSIPTVLLSKLRAPPKARDKDTKLSSCFQFSELGN